MPELNLDEYLALNDVEFTTGELSKASDVISHSGILGMHHGIRRFQYEDDSLTPAGRERYGVGPARDGKGSKALEQSGPASRQEAASKSKHVDKNELKKRQDAITRAIQDRYRINC